MNLGVSFFQLFVTENKLVVLFDIETGRFQRTLITVIMPESLCLLII